MLVESELKIVAQIFLGMDHCLLGRGPLTEVKRVFADDLALAQCRDWIQRNLPAAELVTTESTADSVRLAGTDATAAVVAGAAVASLYDVPVLVRGIQDKRDNITRFLIIGTKVSPPRTDCEYKTSLVLTLKHSPGTLQKALLPLSAGGLNITRIDSRPNRQRAWEYLFFIDITGHWEDAAVQDAMAALRESCSMVKWLGSYLNSQE
jgi:chorismate mutase/prephenate dehydratase